MPKLNIPVATVYADWALSRPKVEAAVAELGIELPVKIRYFPSETPTNLLGRHSCVVSAYEGPMHVIRLNEFMYHSQVSETLWHELAHAQQAELAQQEAGIDATEFFSEVYTRSKGGLGVEYANNSMEVMARQIAAYNKNKELIK